LIGHLQHNLREPNRDHSHGRIWRIKHKTRPLLRPPAMVGQPVPVILDLLKATDDRTRYRARRELAQLPTDQVVPALDTWKDALPASDPEHEHHLLEALWMFQTHNVIRPQLLKTLLETKDHRARAAATRVLSFWLDQVDQPLKWLKPRINDSHPRVRLEAIRALTFLQGDAVVELALEVLNYDMDDYLQFTLDEAMRHWEQ
jgi:HEAT repeat protein